MSSSEFEVDLPVDPRFRQLVLASGCVLAVAGAVIVVSINLPAALRGVLLLLWLIECCREIRNYLAGIRRIHGFRLSASGRVQVLSRSGGTEAAELETGTMVLPAAAWIRVRLADGFRHGELLAKRGTKSRSWHGLQLVWRLCREAFGHPGGA